MSNLEELKNNLISCYDNMKRSAVVTGNDIAAIVEILFQTTENLEARISDLQICECGEKYEYEDAKCKQCYKPICGDCSIVDMCSSCSYPYQLRASDHKLKNEEKLYRLKKLTCKGQELPKDLEPNTEILIDGFEKYRILRGDKSIYWYFYKGAKIAYSFEECVKAILKDRHNHMLEICDLVDK